jgi:CubicO group peptidase (beta-lactamase class C family)
MSFTTINPLANLSAQSVQLQNFAGTSNKIITPQACANALKEASVSYGVNSFKGFGVVVDNAFDKSGSSYGFASTGVRNSLNEAITANNTLFPSASVAKMHVSLAMAKAMELGWFTDSTKLATVCPWLINPTNATGYYLSETTVPATLATNPTQIINFTGALGAFSWLDKPTVGDLMRYDVGMDYDILLVGTSPGSTFLSGEGPIGLATQGGFWGANEAFRILQHMHVIYDNIIPTFANETFTGTWGYNNYTEYVKQVIKQSTNAATNFPAATGNFQCNFNLNTYLGIPASNANDHLPLINVPGGYAGLAAKYATAPYGAIGVPMAFYGYAVQMMGLIIDACAFNNGYYNFANFMRSTIYEPLGLYNIRFGSLDSSYSPSAGKICWTGTKGQVNTYATPTINRWGYGGGYSAITLQPLTGALGDAVTGPCAMSVFGVIGNPVPNSYGLSPAYAAAFGAFLNLGGGALIPPQWTTDFPTDGISQLSLYGRLFNPTGSASSPFTPGANGTTSQSTGWIDTNGVIDTTINDLLELGKLFINKGVGSNGKRVLTPASVNFLLSPKIPGNTDLNIVYGLGPWDNRNTSLVCFGVDRNNRDITGNVLFGDSNRVRTGGADGTAMLINLETGNVIVYAVSYVGSVGDLPSPSALTFKTPNMESTLWQILADYTY